MITAEQAIAIARKLQETDAPAGVMAYRDKAFVVGFEPTRSFNNLSVYVDSLTGQAHTLAVSEYVKLLPELVQVDAVG